MSYSLPRCIKLQKLTFSNKVVNELKQPEVKNLKTGHTFKYCNSILTI